LEAPEAHALDIESSGVRCKDGGERARAVRLVERGQLEADGAIATALLGALADAALEVALQTLRLLLGELDVGDVRRDAGNPVGLSCGVLDGKSAIADPADAAIGPHDAVDLVVAAVCLARKSGDH